MTPSPITVDFETKPIERRPYYPPEPVGVSIQLPGRSIDYYAWGHPSGNNCTRAYAKRMLTWIWKSGEPLLMHNGKFDTDVAEVHFGVPRIDPLRIHDSMFLSFLFNPHAKSFGLKQLAHEILGMSPKERDTLLYWLVEHQEELRRDGIIPATERNLSVGNAGKWICAAPGDRVGIYANGDVERTIKLFKKLYPIIVERGMLEAYQREQRLMPVLLDNERGGMRVRLRQLECWTAQYGAVREYCDNWLRWRLKSASLNVDSGAEVANLLDREGIVTQWQLTRKGHKATNKKAMRSYEFSDEQVLHVLGYRARLSTCLETFMRPWLRTAEQTDGLIHTSWNQVRSPDGGARTGRMSSSPNFQNIPKRWDDKADGYAHPQPTDTFHAVPELPLLRELILPDSPKHWFAVIDQNQQEVRTLAHFENDHLKRAYLSTPRLDVHSFVQKEITKLLSMQIERTPVKTLLFGYMFGQGVPAMAEALRRPVSEIHQLRKAQMAALPGLRTLDRELKAKGRADNALRAKGLPLENHIRTWGGRTYYVEESSPDPEDGERMRSWEYKLLNTLIQGSAADLTKEVLVRYHVHPQRRGRLICAVHDEFDVSIEKRALRAEMMLLRSIILSLDLRVPMLSDAKYGPDWGHLGKLVIKQEPDLTRWNIAPGWMQ
jgi:DNA polymerase I-like protein with 3'-5' exonuclease and polymerase domains